VVDDMEWSGFVHRSQDVSLRVGSLLANYRSRKQMHVVDGQRVKVFIATAAVKLDQYTKAF
jgi:hypothetical protein